MTLRVLHLVSVATMTGPADPALALASAQRRRLGYDARIAYDQMRAGDMAKRVVQYDVPVVAELSLCTKGGLVRAVRDRSYLAEIAPRFDVIHAHSTHDHGIAALVGRDPARLLVRSIHHPRSAARRVGQKLIFDRTDGFFVPAHAHLDRVLESYPSVPRDRVEVVPGAVDPDIFRPGLDGRAFRRSVGIPESAFVVGMIARFQPGRRQPLLIDALARARRESGLDLWLALMGKGETQAEIEAEIAARELGAVSRLYGFRDADLPEAIASCDVTVLLKEGSDAGCRAVLQSLACAVPVIGARFPAIGDAVTDDVGMLVGGEDVEELAHAIVSLARQNIAEMGARGRARVLERYTEAGRVDRVHAAYQRWIKPS